MTIPPIDIVLTCGMHSHLAKVFQTPISQNLSAELGRLVDEFCSQLARILPRNTRLTCYNATDLTKELWHSSRHWGEPFVSLDDTHIRWADAYYRITNLVSWNGEAEWIAKPGSLSVDTQLSALANFRTVILGDIGAQSGQTVLKSIQDLKKAGIHVSRVLLGIASRAAVDRLKGTVPVSTVYEIDLLRWIELKDLLGLDGRLFKDNQGRVLRLPTWETSIRDGPFTEEKKREITALCKSYNRHIVSILGSFGFDQRLLPMHTL